MKPAKNSAHHYTECGLDDVFIIGIPMIADDDDEAVAISNINELHRAIASDIIRRRAYLQGREIRFLRTELGMTQNRLALLLGVDQQTVARWEKNESVAPGPADRLLRLLCIEHIGDGADEKIVEFLRMLAETDHSVRAARRFEKTTQGWRLAA